jgi:hypothetical protein
MSEGTESAKPQQKSSFLGFVVKAAIVTFCAALGIVYVFDSVVETLGEKMDVRPYASRIRDALREDRARLRLRGFFTNNPAVHYRISLIEEQQGRLETAVDEIELAVGLLELHSSDRAAKDRYAARLQDLKRKLAAQTAKNTDAKK